MCVLPQPGALFLTSQLPKVLQTWCVLYVLTSKCAFAPQTRTLFELFNFQKCVPNLRYFQNSDFPMCFGHSGAHFFDLPAPTALASLLLFGPPEPQNSGKTKSFATASRTLRSSFRTLSSLPLPTTVATSFNQLAPLFIAFILTGCAPTVFDYWNLHDTPILGTVPPKKTGKSESLRGFSWGTTRETGQYIPEALWHLVTKADPSCLDRHIMARPWIVHPCSFLIVL